ncbi:MAG: DUF971 domain-containing protein [Armatimonadetes bacterium]|nr:DUF971 domain-containing protein [Armatimonadota bacterium]
MSAEYQPVQIQKVADRELRIMWADGHNSAYMAPQLRRLCPCALCVEEMTGRRLLDPADVSDDIRLLSAEIVGSYALRFSFSDGHGSGIYTFERLRKHR